jgi:16S rRNA (cytosine1402-N4)-methyltransferase
MSQTLDLSHRPVMVNEAIASLNIRAAGCYVDCTFGRGGHSAAILAHLGPTGRLIAFDRDLDAAANDDAFRDSRFELIHSPFSQADTALKERGLAGQIHGVLMDLGVSSPQLDSPTRGFSFRADGPLDMRMDQSTGILASTWINTATESAIRDCLWQYGEERMARQIAAKICAERQLARIETTRQLAELVASVVRRERRIDPATRTFQALRIMINNELDELSTALKRLLAMLSATGRFVVISFHSLEDRIVKRFFRDTARESPAIPEIPPAPKFELVTRRSVVPQATELAENPRARSARLRTLVRIT